MTSRRTTPRSRRAAPSLAPAAHLRILEREPRRSRRLLPPAFGLLLALGLLLTLGLPPGVTAAPGQESPSRPAAGAPPEASLDALGALIVGAWEAAGSRQVHEWGVGRRLIRSRGHSLQEGEWVLVSEGIWFEDAEAGVIRGIHFAVRMPVERFEYRTTVEDNEVVHQLTAHGESVERYAETWTFEGAGYRWRLERPTADGLERVMGGEYRRSGAGAR